MFTVMIKDVRIHGECLGVRGQGLGDGGYE